MSSKEVGLIEKYLVSRVDGKPISQGCIVLEWSDPISREAIKAYSKILRAEGYVKLADDLDTNLDRAEFFENYKRSKIRGD